MNKQNNAIEQFSHFVSNDVRFTPSKNPNIQVFKESVTWPKMNVYDQNGDYYNPTPLNVDNNWCVGAAAANSMQAVRREVGDFAQSIYETAQRYHNPDDKGFGGIQIHKLLHVAMKEWNGSGFYHTTNFYTAMGWIITEAPILIGLKWTSHMTYTTGKGNWWQRVFGPRWMNRGGTPMGYHVVCGIGLSTKRGGYVRIENSHGHWFGSKGVAYLSFDDLKQLIADGDAIIYLPDWTPRSQLTNVTL